MEVVGIVSKDAESIDKDITLIAQLNIDANFTNEFKCIRRGKYYQIQHSSFFDNKLGEYLITPIINEAKLHFRFNEIELIDRIKELSASFIKKLPEDFFPTHWYNYPHLVLDRSKPRPWVKNENPKYRNK